MGTVSDTLVDTQREPLPGVRVLIDLVTGGDAGAFLPDGVHVTSVADVVTDSAGQWSAQLPPSSTLNPAGAYYVARGPGAGRLDVAADEPPAAAPLARLTASDRGRLAARARLDNW